MAAKCPQDYYYHKFSIFLLKNDFKNIRVKKQY